MKILMLTVVKHTLFHLTISVKVFTSIQDGPSLFMKQFTYHPCVVLSPIN